MKCCHCGEEDVPDDLVKHECCEDCFDEYFNWCNVCEGNQRYGYECRHLKFIDSEAIYFGCGSQDVDADGHRESFMSVVGLLHERLTRDEFQAARNAIANLRFLAYFDGLLLWLHEAREYEFVGIRRKSIATIHDEHPDASLRRTELEIGWSWLESLDPNKTPEANAQTVKWIDEWLEERSGR